MSSLCKVIVSSFLIFSSVALMQGRAAAQQQVVTLPILLDRPTTIAISPVTGRVFVGQANGQIVSFDRSGPGGLTPSNVQVNNTIRSQDFTNGRLITGMAFYPGPQTGFIGDLYVAHSDGRLDASANELSGKVTRLLAPFGFTAAQDIVTGLPRSKIAGGPHAPNGLAYRPADGHFYLAVGGRTNAGLPSAFSGGLGEHPLSASILKVNPHQVNLFAVHALGFRNSYDLVWHSNGLLYATDNGANAGDGNLAGANCSVGPDPGHQPSELNLVHVNAFHGHPNPSIGACPFGAGIQPILQPSGSLNGIVEYRSPAAPALIGNLFAANFTTGEVYRIQLAASGLSVAAVSPFAFMSNPLDLTVSADGKIFVIEHFSGSIKVIVP